MSLGLQGSSCLSRLQARIKSQLRWGSGVSCLPACAAAAAVTAVLSSTSALIGSPMIKKKGKENTGGVQKELTIPFNPSPWIALGSSAAQVETQLWLVVSLV